MKWFKTLGTFLEVLCAILMIVMCLCSFAQVANRLIFNKSFIWTDEIVLFSMVWVTFFGSALAVSRNTHTRIDFFVSLFKPRVKGYILAFSDVLCAAFCVALAYVSLPVFRKNMTIYSSGLHLPNAISYFAVIVGSVLMVLLFVLQAYKDATGFVSGGAAGAADGAAAGASKGDAAGKEGDAK